ncbi:MAG: hypothetical protein EOP47_15950 [Sphingobacteriaceae bacterium]|nr:MAG: hypothetical protein EOP47_15950 [Sphingobacteriaceae bacterium]
MISINLSIEQLVEAVSNLSVSEKEQVREVLDTGGILLSEEQKQIVLSRQKDYKSGESKTYSLDEVKSLLNYKED